MDGKISDPSPENQKKYEYAQRHFERLNDWLRNEGIEESYQLNFLTPKAFNRFFMLLRKDGIKDFRSELDIALSQREDG